MSDATSLSHAALRRTRTLGVEVHPLTLGEATQQIKRWLDLAIQRGAEIPCRYVVTPNLDHAVQLRKDAALQAAYAHASLVLSDGMPLIWASRLLGRGIPERVAGSDLGPSVLAAATPGTRAYFLGASEESGQRAIARCQSLYPHVEFVGRLSPPRGFEHDPTWSARIVSDIRTSGAQLVLVGLGAPKQELWTSAHREQLPGTVLLCVGATIDFLAETVERAPVWMQRAGLEWMHRLLSQPGRLAGRYARDALHFPGLLLGDALAGKGPDRTSKPQSPSDT